MAFTVTARDLEGSSTTAIATETLGPFTPSNSSLLVVAAYAEIDDFDASVAFPATPVSGGPTFTTQESYSGTSAPTWAPSANYRLNSGLFRAAIATGSSTTLTVDLLQSGNAFYAALAVDITGHDVASPIVQSAGTRRHARHPNHPSVHAAIQTDDRFGMVNGDNVRCQATDYEHCCWVRGAVCPQYDPAAPLGARCSLRALYDNWEAVYADPRYPRPDKQIGCGDWPGIGNTCNTCGEVQR